MQNAAKPLTVNKCKLEDCRVVERSRRTAQPSNKIHCTSGRVGLLAYITHLIIIAVFTLPAPNGRVQALRYAIQFHESSDENYRYELHWFAATFTGAMATCQSRANGQGVLTPLATEEELSAVSDLLAMGCCTQSIWTDEFFFVGLTTLEHQHHLGFLDRPRPGSSTAFLRAVAAPGQGFVNGSWPDAPAPSAAGTVTEVSGSGSPAQPLCAAVRLLLSSPAAAGGAAAAAASAPAAAAQPPMAACGGAARGLTCDSEAAHQLEVNFHSCDGGPMGQGNDGGGVKHAFVCRVPIVPRKPPPAPVPPLSPRPARPTSLLGTQPGVSAPPGEPEDWPPEEWPPLEPDQPPSPPPSQPRPVGVTTPRGLPQPPRPRSPPPSGPAASSAPPAPAPAPRPAPAPAPALAAASSTARRPPTPAALPTPPAAITPSAAHVLSKCDSEVLLFGGAAGGATRYLACHVAASWSEAAELCSDLLPGGKLAAFESQAQMDELSRALGAKDLGGSYDFWFGLASGASWSGSPPLLEYVLTDPRVTPIFPSQLWGSGALAVHASCAADPEPPSPPLPPSPPSPPSPPPQPPSPSPYPPSPPPRPPRPPWPPSRPPQPPSPPSPPPNPRPVALPPPPPPPSLRATPPSPGRRRPVLKASPRPSPFPFPSPAPPPPARTPPQATPASQPPSGSAPTATPAVGPRPPPRDLRTPAPPPAAATPPPVPLPPPPPLPPPATHATVLPLPSGCCASLTILPAAPGNNSTAGDSGGPQLRACYHTIKFICQAPASADPGENESATPRSDGAGGAITLLASLFLDALEPSYRGAYRVFQAQLELRLVGAPFETLAAGDGDPAVEAFRNETSRQLSQVTQLPAWAFAVLALRSGSVVADVNLTVRGLPRATLANFSDFVSTSLVGRQPLELFSAVFVRAWSVQESIVTVVSLSELSDPPSPPALSRRSNRLMLIIAAVLGGVLTAGVALAVLLLLRRRQQQRHGAALTLTSLVHDTDVDALSLRKAKAGPPPPPLHLERTDSVGNSLSARPPKPLTPVSSLRRMQGSPSSWQLQQLQGSLQGSPSGRAGESWAKRQVSRSSLGTEATEGRTFGGSGGGGGESSLLYGGLYGYGYGYGGDASADKATPTHQGSAESAFSRRSGRLTDVGATSLRGRSRPEALDVGAFGLSPATLAATAASAGVGSRLSYDDVSMPNSPAVPQAAARLTR
ncbi:hypothetical protein PLESTB_000352600 [Pleodorina starrii]|uniref:C-type lectin domain-containing protein n=1 Tax=Pleodorina starrii TaxID=330485 RepID=A0A9W6BDT5_9CHLO|nr:hypothetical protein PLESTM_000042700 [Pleodorina starrii]GLC50193.1 hypothetical protein PLESTB_000352600 [Pleodorina starrii]GLC73030.1 hypothetical protein PLESTF_001324100 [Pleodorina starrii]